MAGARIAIGTAGCTGVSGVWRLLINGILYFAGICGVFGIYIFWLSHLKMCLLMKKINVWNC